jgi:PAT family beta-lactamase induction signal transducer AmpG
VSAEKKGNAHPVVFLLLCTPFGASNGYLVVTLAYLLSHAGVGVGAIAGLIALSLVPQTWKIVWAPLVDTTLNSKLWYLMAAVASAVTLGSIGLFPISQAGLFTITVLVLTNSVATSVVAMAAENLMAHATAEDQKGRAGGWYQAGNLGGQGVGGGAALWLAQHFHEAWLPSAAMAALFLACCLALLFVEEPATDHRHPSYFHSLFGVVLDVWNTAKARPGYLALLICFLPIGSGAASGLWASVAGDWQANADTVALVNGVLGGVVSAIGCVFGGYLCDRMDRKFAYLLFGMFLAVGALAMAAAARTPAMFVSFTLLYAFVSGLNYAAFSALVLEAIGRGAAATKYNLYAALSNIPIAYMTWLEGKAYVGWHANGLLLADALAGVIAIAFFLVVSAATRPRVVATA